MELRRALNCSRRAPHLFSHLRRVAPTAERGKPIGARKSEAKMNPIRHISVMIAAYTACHCYAAADTATTNEPSAPKPYTVNFVGTAQGPRGQVMLAGRGQCLVTNLVVTSYSVADISSTNIQLKAENSIISFEVTPATRVCADGKKAALDSFKKDDVVTVTAKKTDQKKALSVRKGPMFFSLGQAGATPQDYDCPE